MTTKDELKAKLELEKKQLAERQKTKLAKFDKSARKIQTRKKIILGSIVLKLISTGNKNFVEYLRKNLSSLKTNEKELFPEIFNIVVESETTNN
jgi:hypothetical protein